MHSLCPKRGSRHGNPLGWGSRHGESGITIPKEKSPVEGRSAWAKLRVNPLFKVSGRFTTGTPTSKEEKRSPPSPASSSGSQNRKSCARTSSGGYFSTTSLNSNDSKFWAKLELERKRKEMLKAISSRRFSDNNLGDDSDKYLSEGVSVGDAEKEARQSLEEARSSLERTLSSSNPLLDAGVDQEDYARGDAFEPLDMKEGKKNQTSLKSNNRWEASLGMKQTRKDILNTMNRLSNRSLEHIPEVSEHSEGSPRRRSHDMPPMRVAKRISSEEMSSRADGSEIFESSNELTIRSTGSSIRTLKRSNRRTSSEPRLSNSGDSTDVSLVSDTPMSDDDFLSVSSSDCDSDEESSPEVQTHESVTSAEEHLPSGGAAMRNKMTKMRSQQRELRESLRELQRLSERSMEDGLSESSRSFHIDTGNLLQRSEDMDSSGHTEDA